MEFLFRLPIAGRVACPIERLAFANQRTMSACSTHYRDDRLGACFPSPTRDMHQGDSQASLLMRFPEFQFGRGHVFALPPAAHLTLSHELRVEDRRKEREERDFFSFSPATSTQCAVHTANLNRTHVPESTRVRGEPYSYVRLISSLCSGRKTFCLAKNGLLKQLLRSFDRRQRYLPVEWRSAGGYTSTEPLLGMREHADAEEISFFVRRVFRLFKSASSGIANLPSSAIPHTLSLSSARNL